MKFLSVCSGIEAASVAWHPLGWESVAYSEIEPFPCKVLQHHYPAVPNLGDMTKFKEWPDADVDVFVGGTPCQSFSVAGLRKGLDDPRGNLMLTFLAIAKQYRPNWLVWENVPGVLSSAGGRDFGSLLGGLAECGYGFAYRVLDAQYFGVAQRRRRVFVVGYLGDWRPAAAVLFERHSLQGHPAPSRKAREGVAGDAREGAQIGRWPADVSSTLDTTFGTKMGLENQQVNAGCPMFVPAVKTLVGLQDCNNFSSEITGTIVTREGCASDTAHMVMQPIPIDSMNHIGRGDKHSMGDFVPGAPSYTLTKGHSHAVAQPIALAENTIGRKPENGGNGDGFTDGGPMYTLNATGVHGVAQPIAFAQNTRDEVRIVNGDGNIVGALAAQPGMKQTSYVAQPIGIFQDSEFGIAEYDTAGTLRAGRIPAHQMAIQAMAVRRLTPVECERLQGFPDNYTDIQHKGKATPDGPRYKALGNSMAVPVMAWIGKRIQEVDAICKTQQNT